MNYDDIAQSIRTGDAERTVPAMCLRTLTEIAEGRNPLRAVRHPLGFLCLPVQRAGELGVCVHVWTGAVAQASSSVSTVHSHSWDLVSFVLYGDVGNALMRVEDDSAGTHRVFEVHSRGDVDEILPTARLVRCLRQPLRVTSAGRTYRLTAGEFHESVLVGDSEAATVVLGRTRAEADLSLGPLDGPGHQIIRQRCSRGETEQAARIVVQKLAIAVGGTRRG
jgi:hypothetical protein